jgi:hypothetical protein
MSYTAAYTDMVTAVQAAVAAWTGQPNPLKVEYENRELIDSENEFETYVGAEMHYLGGEQLSIGRYKDVAAYGQIHIVAHAPKAAGSLNLHVILDHFQPFLEIRDFTTLRTMAGLQTKTYEKPGWYCRSLVIPFRTIRLVTS